MTAYYIVFVEKPADPAEIAEYRRLALPTLKDREVKFHTRPGCERLVPFARIPECGEASPRYGAKPCRDRQ